MGLKKCFKCGLEKSRLSFYKHKAMGDGLLGKCKECTKKDANETRDNNLEYYREYDRKRSWLPKRIEKRKEVAKRWQADPKLRKRSAESGKRWQERNREKRAAHTLTWAALRSGKIIKNPCAKCGRKKTEAHHDDYTKPLDIRWLCKKHHMEHHRLEREKERNKWAGNETTTK